MLIKPPVHIHYRNTLDNNKIMSLIILKYNNDLMTLTDQ